MFLVEFYQAHSLWAWLAVAAIVLVAEILTGSGWLLWPAACAAVVAGVSIIPGVNFPIELAVFAVLTTVTSLTARRYLPKRQTQPGDDINDRAHHLIGKTGEVTAAKPGHLRVFVDGAEWEAEGEGLSAGAKVRVTKVLGGAKVRVEAA